MAWRLRLPEKSPALWVSLLLGAGLAVAGSLVQRGLTGVGVPPFEIYFPLAALASTIGGLGGGVACLLFASLSVAFLQGGASPLAFALFWLGGGGVAALASALAEKLRNLAANEASAAEAHQQLKTLVGELAHRNRNSLFVLMAIVSQSTARATSTREAEAIINGRLQALVRAQEALIQTDGTTAILRSIVEGALTPFELGRFEIDDGGIFPLNSEVAVGLSLLFHELATNALKYGALSSAAGRVVIRWRLADGRAALTWKELGGPQVDAPSRRGFGSRLIETALAPQGGKVERRFEADGLFCEFRIPPKGAAAPAAAGAALVEDASMGAPL